MDKTLTELSTEEIEELARRTIDRRLEVWVPQSVDVRSRSEVEAGLKLRAGLPASDGCSLGQSESGQETALSVFLEQIGH